MQEPQSEKRGGVSPLLLIFITILIDLIGFGMVVPLLPFYAQELAPHYSQETVNVLIGVIVGAYSFAQFFFTPLLGRLSDRVGRRPVLLVSVFCTGLAFLALGWANSLWMLLAARLFDGATGGNVSTAQAYIADVTTPENRAKGMGLIGAGFGLGFILGPGLGGLLSSYSIHAPFFFAAALAFTNSILIYFFLPESLKEKRPTSLNLADHFRDVGRALSNSAIRTPALVLFIATLAFGIFQPLFPLFAQTKYGYDQTQVSYLFVYSGLIGVLIQGGLIGRMVKSASEKSLLLAGMVALIVAYLTLPWTPALMPLLAVLGLMAIGTSFVSSMLPTLVSKYAPATEQGRVLGITQAAGSLARAVGPLLGGWLLASGGIVRPFYACATLILIAFLFSLSRLGR
ncbi:MAG: MFS transporter [Blastocatellia bacterium]|nr:MFS transporter [Blastocatellia bacterium]